MAISQPKLSAPCIIRIWLKFHFLFELDAFPSSDIRGQIKKFREWFYINLSRNIFQLNPFKASSLPRHTLVPIRLCRVSLRTLRGVLSLGKPKKSTGAKSDEYMRWGGTVIIFCAKQLSKVHLPFFEHFQAMVSTFKIIKTIDCFSLWDL